MKKIQNKKEILMCSLNQNVFDDAAGPNMATPSSKIDDNFITKNSY